MNESKEKFTPGPWIVLHDTNVVSPCNGYIARAYESPLGPIANRYNATLIACAPEMYVLLERLQKGHKKGNATWQLIERVLAKARGEVAP